MWSRSWPAENKTHDYGPLQAPNLPLTHARAVPAWAAVLVPPLVLVLLQVTWVVCSSPWDPDEARYLEIGREMAESGDLTVPTLNGVAYLEKPPLYLWALVAAFKGLGEGEVSARLVSVAAGAGTAALVAWTGTFLGGAALGLRAGLMAATAPLAFGLSSVITLDSLLGLWIAGAIACFAHGTTGSPAERPWRKSVVLIGYASLGLALLTKGPVALVVPGLVWLTWRPAGTWRILPPLFVPGLLLLLLIAVPWHLAVQLKFPSFVDFYFLRGHLARLTAADVENVNFHGEPWHFYLPIFLGGCAPWILLLCVPRPGIGKELRREGSLERLGWCWIVPGFLFFSAVSGKLPTYVLPLVPGVALLAAERWERLLARGRWASAFLLFWGGSAVLAALGGRLIASLHADLWWLTGVNWTLALGGAVACLVGGVLARGLLGRGRGSAAFLSFAAGLGALLLTAGGIKGSVDQVLSTESLARQVREVMRPGDVLACWNKYLPLFAFHLGHPVQVVGHRGELDYGSEELHQRPDLFWDVSRLKARLDEPGRVFVTCSRRRAARFEQQMGRKLHLLGSTRYTLLFSTQAEPWPGPARGQE